MNDHETRLTDDDAIRAIDAMRAAAKEWHRLSVQNRTRGKFGAVDFDTLVRIGASAIGCALHDLRDSETQWLNDAAAIIAADVWAGASDFLTWKLAQVTA